MASAIEGCQRGIQWTLSTQLEDIDFADDVALLSHCHDNMQDKATSLNESAAKLGLKINKMKTRTMKPNHVNKNSIQLKGEDIEDVEQFTYLGSVVSRDSGTDRDIKSRIGKTTAVFKTLRPIWTYACETWHITKALAHKVQTFVNRCLRAILHIKWQDKITNEEIWRRTGQAQAEAQMKRRKWDCLGHTLRKPKSSVVHHALKWNPQRKRKGGRPCSTWRRSVETEG